MLVPEPSWLVDKAGSMWADTDRVLRNILPGALQMVLFTCWHDYSTWLLTQWYRCSVGALLPCECAEQCAACSHGSDTADVAAAYHPCVNTQWMCVRVCVCCRAWQCYKQACDNDRRDVVKNEHDASYSRHAK